MTGARRPHGQGRGEDDRGVLFAAQAGQHPGHVHVRGGQHARPVECPHQTVFVLAQDKLGVRSEQGTRLPRGHQGRPGPEKRSDNSVTSCTGGRQANTPQGWPW